MTLDQDNITSVEQSEILSFTSVEQCQELLDVIGEIKDEIFQHVDKQTPDKLGKSYFESVLNKHLDLGYFNEGELNRVLLDKVHDTLNSGENLDLRFFRSPKEIKRKLEKEIHESLVANDGNFDLDTLDDIVLRVEEIKRLIKKRDELANSTPLTEAGSVNKVINLGESLKDVTLQEIRKEYEDNMLGIFQDLESCNYNVAADFELIMKIGEALKASPIFSRMIGEANRAEYVTNSEKYREKNDDFENLAIAIRQLGEEYNEMTVEELEEKFSMQSKIDQISDTIDSVQKEFYEKYPNYCLDATKEIENETLIGNIGVEVERLIGDVENGEIRNSKKLKTRINEIRELFREIGKVSLMRKTGKTLLNREDKSKALAYDAFYNENNLLEEKVQKRIFSSALGIGYSYKNIQYFTLNELHETLSNQLNYIEPDNDIISLGFNLKPLEYNLEVGAKSLNGAGKDSAYRENEKIGNYYPKIKNFLALLKEEGIEDQVDFYHTDNKEYYIAYVPSFDKTVVISDKYGCATYIYAGKINLNRFKNESLRSICDERYCDRVEYHPSKEIEIWMDQILGGLKGDLNSYSTTLTRENKRRSGNNLVTLFRDSKYREILSKRKEFGAFVIEWNNYIESKIKGEAYQGNLDEIFIDYIDNNERSVESLKLDSEVSISRDGKKKDAKPYTGYLFLEFLLKETGLDIDITEIMNYHFTKFFGKFSQELLDYYYTKKSETEDNEGDGVIMRRQRVIKVVNEVKSHFTPDIYFRDLFILFDEVFEEERMVELFKSYLSQEKVTDFEGFNLNGCKNIYTLRALLGVDTYNNEKEPNVMLDDLRRLKKKQELLKLGLSGEIKDFALEIVCDFAGVANGIFKETFGDISGFLTYIGGDIQLVETGEIEDIINEIEAIIIANKIVETYGLSEDFKSQLDFSSYSLEELYQMLNDKSYELKSSLSMKGIDNSIDDNKKTLVYNKIIKLTGYNPEEIDVSNPLRIRDAIKSYRRKYTKFKIAEAILKHRYGYEPSESIISIANQFETESREQIEKDSIENNTIAEEISIDESKEKLRLNDLQTFAHTAKNSKKRNFIKGYQKKFRRLSKESQAMIYKHFMSQFDTNAQQIEQYRGDISNILGDTYQEVSDSTVIRMAELIHKSENDEISLNNQENKSDIKDITDIYELIKLEKKGPEKKYIKAFTALFKGLDYDSQNNVMIELLGDLYKGIGVDPTRGLSSKIGRSIKLSKNKEYGTDILKFWKDRNNQLTNPTIEILGVLAYRNQ